MIKKYLTPVVVIVSWLFLPLAFAKENSNYKKLPFFTDSQLHFQAKNLWRYLNDADDYKLENRFIQSAWGQGFAVDYKSGYIADTIGFNASYYGIIKLYANKNFNGRGVFYRVGDGKAEGFSKVGQRYLKLKFGNENLGMKINYGWQELPVFGAITRSYTLSPNTYLGVTSITNWSDFTFKAGYVTSSINRNSAHKIQFRGVDNSKINSIFVGQLIYKNNYINSTYFYGQSRNYLQRHAVELSYLLDKNWKINGKVYSTFAMTHYKNMPNTIRITARKPFDKRGMHYVLDGEYHSDNWRVILGAGYTQAKKSEGVGYYPIHLATHSRGTFNAFTSAGNDYMRNKETALYSSFTRYINKEISLTFNANYGNFKYKGHAIQSGDIAFIGKWKPQNQYLKGLGCHLLFSPVNWSYANYYETPILNKNNHVQRKHSQSVEFYITYDIDLF